MLVDRSLVKALGAACIAAGVVVACGGTTPSASTSLEPDAASPSDADTGAVAEADVDAGADADAAPRCSKPADCASRVCNVATGECKPPTCADGVANGPETDVDCGGSCAPCDVAKGCKVGGDCTSGVCADGGAGLRCQAPSNTDGVKNGDETGVDCGGAGNPRCADGQGCVAPSDCTSDSCKAGACAAPTPADGVKNGDETDVDCGGPDAPRCADGLKCGVDADCKSDVCKDTNGTRLCQIPSATDGKKNGTETDVDCGGAGNPTCKAGKTCAVGGDCASGGCNYQLKCAAGRSCTARYGGDTCGAGGEGGVGAEAWEDCCRSLPVTTTTGGTMYLDKYPVTAGRMRAFLTAIDYDVRAFVQQARAAGEIPVIPANVGGTADGVHPVLDAAWDAYLPTSFGGNTGAGEIADCDQGTWDYKYSVCCESVPKPGPGCPAGTTLADDNRCHYYDSVAKTCPAQRTGKYPGTYTAISRHLGGTIFRANAQTSTGCFVGAPGTHSFRFPDDKQDGSAPEQGQDVYDTKTQNCVDYLVGQAFCVWDGGRLETFPEWQAAWGADANPYGALTSTLPAEPNQRCKASSTCTTGAPQATINTQCNTDGEAKGTYTCAASKCCLAGGDQTYWGCRFPWATDAAHPDCGLDWASTASIEYADYKYSYEYPKSKDAGDYIVFLTAPGRTRGRGPLGHADVIGAGFELTSSVTYNVDLFTARHRWSGNGSWEVHNYGKGYSGNTMLLNKYGKLGLRCARPASYE
jgi:hypothetical protein